MHRNAVRPRAATHGELHNLRCRKLARAYLQSAPVGMLQIEWVSPTHAPSHELVQQKLSLAQTRLTQGSHSAVNAAPAVQ